MLKGEEMKFVIRWSVHLAVYSSLLFSSCVNAQKSETTGVPQTRVSVATNPIASLPAEMVLSGGILLQTRVNDSEPLWFVLDSGGGSGFIIDRRRADTLGLELRGRAKSTGAGENYYDVTFANNIRITLAGIEFPPQTVRVISLSSLEPFAGRTLDGAIGFGLFSRYVVEIDYATRKVNLYDSQSYHYSGSGTRLPLTMEDNHFFVPAKVAIAGRGTIDGKFMVDTGAVPMTLILNRPFVEKHGLLASLRKRILDRSLPGLGGETKQILSRASMIRLGGLTIHQPTISLSQDAQGALASPDFDGVIGGELLRRFKVIFDPARRQLILEPNAHFTEPYEHSMSGIGLRAEGENFRVIKVHRVIEDSPASEAGLREGDVIVAIGDQPVSSFTLDQLYQMFKQEGREYDIVVMRGGERLQAKLRLRRLA
ncbi:MAG: aspartyl protease family protein [Pyrinomonadaceae bacterium]|nr:aspartyl protease family protein [Pyrinomonadaceae bacterium]